MVTMGAIDLSGTRTTMGQVVAEKFSLPSSDIHIGTGDTKSVGYMAPRGNADPAEGEMLAETAAIRLPASWPWTASRPPSCRCPCWRSARCPWRSGSPSKVPRTATGRLAGDGGEFIGMEAFDASAPGTTMPLAGPSVLARTMVAPSLFGRWKLALAHAVTCVLLRNA